MPSPSPLSNHRHHHHILPLFLPSALLLSSKSAMGAEHRIKTPAEFTDFVNSVNTNGESYNGTTVYLDSDLSLSGVTDPIGKSNSKYFRGVFDGQGHTISNLNINSTTNYASLFGYSTGLTIRNVVLDESCSIVGSFIDSSGYTYVSGFIGHCTASAGSCAIENNVNMGSVTFDGTNDQLRLAGIASQLGSSVSYTTYVRNCVNYGPLTHSGTNKRTSNIGGIVGSLGDTEYYKYIQNCANYGTIMHSGTTPDILRIAGIVGYTSYGHIENCLSVGRIYVSNEPSPFSYKGSIVGCANPPTNISYCYFTDDVNINSFYGNGSPIMTNTPTSASTINPTLLSSLNAQATSNGWNKWLLNTNKAEISFKVNDYNGFSTTSQLVLLPDPTESDRGMFKGWFTDSSYSSPLTSYEVSGATTLYGLYVAKVVVTFNAIGGALSQQSKNVTYGEEYGDLPSAEEKTEHTFDGWFTEADGGVQVTSETTVTTANDHTLYAQWTPNNYTITFNATGGASSQQSKNVTYGEEYGDLPSAGEKTGHTFDGWFTVADGGVQVTSETTVTTANDHTLYAHWTLNKYIIAFNFNNGTENEVRTLSYNEAIVYPEDPTKEGHTFNGWSPKPAAMPAGNITVTAQWIEKPSEYVEIVFGKKDLKEEDVREILQAYTQEEFVIEKIEEDEETGEVRVIVKFVDQTKAAEFVRNINENEESEENFVKGANVVSDHDSFSFPLSPLPFPSFHSLMVLLSF